MWNLLKNHSIQPKILKDKQTKKSILMEKSSVMAIAATMGY